MLIVLDFNAAHVGEERNPFEKSVPEGGRTLHPYLAGGLLILPLHRHILSLNYEIVQLGHHLKSNSNYSVLCVTFI